MSELLSKAPFSGKVEMLLANPDREAGLEKARVPEIRLEVTPAMAARLNERQRKMMARAAEGGEVTNRWCVQHLNVVKDNAHRDLVELVDLGLLVRIGQGRSVVYRLRPAKS